MKFEKQPSKLKRSVPGTAARPAPTKTRNSPAPPASKLKAPAPAPTVRIEYYAPQAREVCLAGCFNQWTPSSMSPQREKGVWVRDLVLAPGRYEYLFLVDGQWLPDPQAKEHTSNPFGGINSLLSVPGSPAAR